jgi:hypothetical protein
LKRSSFLSLVDELPWDFLDNLICQIFFDRSLCSIRPLIHGITKGRLTLNSYLTWVLLTVVPSTLRPTLHIT